MHPIILSAPILAVLATAPGHALADDCPDAVGRLLEAARVDPALGLTAEQHQRLSALARQACDEHSPVEGDTAAAPPSPTASFLDQLTRETEKTPGHQRLERLKR